MSQQLNEAAVEGRINDWGEVVTREPYRKVRLDHLLSRENVEGETRRHILRSIEHSNVFVRDRQERLPKEPLGSNVLRFILCIVFRVRENQTSQAMRSI